MSNFNSEQDREQHKQIIGSFLQYLNQQHKDGEYVLKGGTSLMMFYGLTRFSEDIDLDQIHEHGDLIPIVDRFCKIYGYDYRVAKNTPTVQRCMIHYDKSRDDILLKIEVSRRSRSISPSLYTIRDGVKVYNIDVIALLKNNAFENREQLRDLHDICFICNNYYDALPESTQMTIAAALDHKGLGYADWIVQSQSDPLIDKDALMESILNAYNVCGLIDNDTPAFAEDRENDLSWDDEGR